MNTRTQTLWLGGSILSLGLIGDDLFRSVPLGLNAALWGLALTSASFWLADQNVLAAPLRSLFGGLALLALLFVGRASGMLMFTTACAFLGLLFIGVHLSQARLRPGTSLRPSLLRVGATAWLVRPVRALIETDWSALATDHRKQQTILVGRGLLVAVPLLLVFTPLLASADAAFESMVADVFDFSPWTVFTHLFLTGLFGWVAGGFMDGTLHPYALPATSRFRIRLGAVEVGTVLGLVNLLFAAFVVVQLPYLFGGQHTVLTTEGLTVAAYARRGFFELVTVAALALCTLLVLHRWLKARAPGDRHMFRWMAGAQTGLLMVMLASAVQRMWLYQQSYGLTVLRVFVSACLCWLAVVLCWFAWTVLRGQAARFLPGAAVAGVVIVVGLHALNPEAHIVRVNAARATDAEPFDAHYAARLSADAVPALLEVLPALPADDQRTVAAHLLWRYTDEPVPDRTFYCQRRLTDIGWRSWTYARARARQRVQAQVPYLTALAAAIPGDAATPAHSPD